MNLAVRIARAIAALAGDGTTPAARAATQNAPGNGKGKPTPGAPTPESGAATPCAPRPPVPTTEPLIRTIPAIEDLRNWRPAPAHRHEFHDAAMGDRLDRWAEEVA